MKSRLTLIFSALVVLLFAMVWMVQDRLPAAAPRSAAAEQPFTPTPLIAQDNRLPVAIAPVATTPNSASPAAAVTIAGLPVTAVDAAPVAVVAPAAPPIKAAPMVHVDASGEVRYVARAGDTVSQLAIAMLGSDSEEHRNAVIAANASLQANPDRVLEGQSYSLTAPAAADAPLAAPAATSAPAEAASAKPAADPAVLASGPNLKYTAQPGDTVAGLAAHLLGGDTKANREVITASNASLQQNPDHLEAGKSYTIVAPNGLAADPAVAAAPTRAPTNGPDADDAAKLSVGRVLRYTAQPGDTVSKLAEILLGSDTKANRDLIIKSNATLQQDPDHLIAGQTYWISAPIADSAH